MLISRIEYELHELIAMLLGDDTTEKTGIGNELLMSLSDASFLSMTKESVCISQLFF